MKLLEQGLATARVRYRRALARLGISQPAWVRPARLVLRLDCEDPPGVGGSGARLDLERWREVVVSAVAWLGPVPVTILAGSGGGSEEVGALVRFAHRLSCPVTLVCDGTGVDEQVAGDLIDRGLARLRVRVAGVSDAVQRQVVGNSMSSATQAVLWAVAARRGRTASLDVEVAIPWRAGAEREARALVGWARQVGVDGFSVEAPWLAEGLADDSSALEALADEPPPFNRTPRPVFQRLEAMARDADGAPGVRRAARSPLGRVLPCPVGSRRIVVTSRGRVHACPFKDPQVLRGDSLPQTWARMGEHLTQVRRCDRSCVHPELC